MSDQDKGKSFLSIFEDVSKLHESGKGKNGHPHPSLAPPLEEENYDHEVEGLALTDELDHEILMHRDAHFGGDFSVMLEYYQNEGFGAHPDFDFDRIAYLAEVEKQLGQDLASTLLTGPEAERVSRARRAYELLKEVYEIEEGEEKSPFPRLLADLILSEDDEPEAEIEALVSQGTRIVPELTYIIKSEEAYDPLFPGYGYAPYLAILCLGKIKDPSSVIPLFERLGQDMVFEEEVILDALRQIGDPAKEFLINVLKGRPLTKDTVNAAYALTMFADQPDVAIACFEQLRDPEVCEKPLLRSYLLSNCEGLQGTAQEEALSHMLHNSDLPPDFRQEIENIIREWH